MVTYQACDVPALTGSGRLVRSQTGWTCHPLADDPPPARMVTASTYRTVTSRPAQPPRAGQVADGGGDGLVAQGADGHLERLVLARRGVGLEHQRLPLGVGGHGRGVNVLRVAADEGDEAALPVGVADLPELAPLGVRGVLEALLDGLDGGGAGGPALAQGLGGQGLVRPDHFDLVDWRGRRAVDLERPRAAAAADELLGDVNKHCFHFPSPVPRSCPK